MKVQRVSEQAKLPTKAHAGDLGYDLYASDQITIYPSETKLIPTGIKVQFPEGYGALIRDRSSIATKKELFVVAGVIDNGYTGEILIALHNVGNNFQTVYMGDKVAQMILINTVDFPVEEVDNVVSMDNRASAGFGSTGT